ncbi:hypothetical protein DMN91_006007 [Ooceraea biroi]|uniref:Uncharacterized protein n=2 Tax=Ooceraea biroi TaxID=2015173 RepID=A0A3L8DMH9_OOCBI|nr:uncharacterized protein LOC105276704 isoform X1 [Ooceraea biroi]RLU21634.1 hypothetical protein DMN91_006007 [Ooceraea biroi]
MESERNSSQAEGKLKIYLTYGVILLVIFANAAYKAPRDGGIASLIATCFVTFVFATIFLLCDVALRPCRTLVSLADASQRAGGSLASLASCNFALNTASATTVVIGALLFLGLTVATRRCPLNYVWDFGPYVCIPSMIFSFCLLRMIELADWEGEPCPLSAMKGLDYGTGMAYSYYYGYLRVILPSTGTATKGIIEKIENFEDNHNITFPVHRMFILIPSSGYIPPDLKDASCQWMESAQELEAETRNRAGTIRRNYHNSAYKIYPDGQKSSKPKYVVVEGATPLLTYYEIQKHNHPESAVYQRYKKQIQKSLKERITKRHIIHNFQRKTDDR